mmetsp:Transcript_126250/g.288981  ORF Transcript_126250/g.288981 Transcript_126250/m.288981 type:complete len:282 (-) Transcript_126250:247-1092(-)
MTMDVVYRGTFLELRGGDDDSPSRRVRSEERPWDSPNGRRINHLADLWSEVRKDEIKSFFDGSPASQGSPQLRGSQVEFCVPTDRGGPVAAFGIDLGGFSLADFATTAKMCSGLGLQCAPAGIALPSGSPAGSPCWGASPPGLGRRAGFPAPPVDHCHVPRNLENERLAQLDSEKRSKRTEASADRKPDATTLMLRNIPNKVPEEKLREFLDDTPVRGTYDVVHLPTDAKSGHNRGYAFINFCSAETFRAAMAELRCVIAGASVAAAVTADYASPLCRAER